MLDFSHEQNYYIACGYTDIRKQIDGLATLVQIQFGQCNKRRTYVQDDGNQQLSLFDMQAETENVPALDPSPNPEKEFLWSQPEKSARWKSSVCRCLWKRESWICRTMKR